MYIYLTPSRSQIATKRAARKIEEKYINAESEEEESSTPSVSSNEGARLDTDDDTSAQINDNDPEIEPEIIPFALEPPPVITIPLRQIAPKIAPKIRPPSPPTEDLISAIELLALAPFRMQETKQLPFLRRQVRSGFIARCKSLGVPTTKVEGAVSLLVRYEYAGEISCETTINDWLCPLCEIHDSFNTREMLVCHLKWDHAEVFVEWDQSSWEVRTSIFE